MWNRHADGLLAKEGYDMDVSGICCRKQSKKRQNPGANFIYCRICANLNCTGRSGGREFCDSLNYILDYDDLAHVFSLVNYLIRRECSFST